MSKKVMSADNQQERLGKKHDVNPWYITGFVEGEGTFHVAIYKDAKMKFGIKIIPEFHVNQSLLRIDTLQAIQKFFQCGYIKENHRGRKNDITRVYVVRNKEDLMEKIIPFFLIYPLISVKHKSFLIFRKIVEKMMNGAHSTRRGIRDIINLAYTMNDDGKYRQTDKQDLLTCLKSSETIR